MSPSLHVPKRLRAFPCLRRPPAARLLRSRFVASAARGRAAVARRSSSLRATALTPSRTRRPGLRGFAPPLRSRNRQRTRAQISPRLALSARLRALALRGGHLGVVRLKPDSETPADLALCHYSKVTCLDCALARPPRSKHRRSLRPAGATGRGGVLRGLSTPPSTRSRPWPRAAAPLGRVLP